MICRHNHEWFERKEGPYLYTQERTERPKTPEPRGKSQEDATNLGCPHENGQNQDSHIGRIGTTSTRLVDPAWVTSPDMQHTDTARLNNRVPCCHGKNARGLLLGL